MRRTITINGKDYEMKANLGTGMYYRMLTGRDWLQDLTKITRKEADFDINEAIIEMAYCMNVHAITDNYEEAEKKMNKKSFFYWKDEGDFDLGSFNREVSVQIINLWNSQRKNTIEGKN